MLALSLRIGRAAFASAMRLYALISIASLKPARLVSIVSPFRSSGSANAIECSRKSSPPSFSFATPISSAMCSSFVTSIGCRNATCGLPSVSFVTRPRFFLRSSSGLSGMYEKPHVPPSSRIRSAIAQAIDCLLNTPVIRPAFIRKKWFHQTAPMDCDVRRAERVAIFATA